MPSPPTLPTNAADRLQGFLIGAAIGDVIGRPGHAESITGRRAPRWAGQRAIVSAALALLAAPDDAARFRRAWVRGWRLLCPRDGANHFPLPARAVLWALLAGAVHAENPWLRYRFAAAAAPPPLTGDALDVASACQFAARAAALAVGMPMGHRPCFAMLAPERALVDLGWDPEHPRSGVEPPPRQHPDLASAADRWESVAIQLTMCARSGAPVGNLMENLVFGLGVEGWEYGDAPLAAYTWWAHHGDFRKTVGEAGLHAASEAGPAIAGALAGACLGRAQIPGDLLAEVDRGPFGVATLDRLGAALADGTAVAPRGLALAALLTPVRRAALGLTGLRRAA